VLHVYYISECLSVCTISNVGRDSSVGIATGFGLGGPGIESRSGRDFPHFSRPAPGPTGLLYNGYRVYSGGKKRPGRDADPSPHSSAVVKKSRAIPLTPLWPVRPVQSLSVCTRVHFTLPFTVSNCVPSAPLLMGMDVVAVWTVP